MIAYGTPGHDGRLRLTNNAQLGWAMLSWLRRFR